MKKKKKKEKKITRSTPLGSSRAGYRSYQRICLPFPSMARLSPRLSFCLFTRNLSNVQLSLFFSFHRSPSLFLSLLFSISISLRLAFTSIFLIIVGTRMHTSNLPPYLFLSLSFAHPHRISLVSHIHTHADLGHGMPGLKAAFTTDQDLTLDARRYSTSGFVNDGKLQRRQ